MGGDTVSEKTLRTSPSVDDKRSPRGERKSDIGKDELGFTSI